MGINLQNFANGDTNYVPKHNQNNAAIASAINGLDAQIQAAAGAAVSEGSAFVALFGTQAAIVGAQSYLPTVNGTNLEVAAGFFWRPSTSTLSRTVGTTVLPFTGVAAGTYYLQVDASGAVTRSTTSSEAVYSVVWNGSAFGTITRLAVIVFGAADWLAAQVSTALAASYTSLDARLEAGEALIAGAAPRASPTFTGVPSAPTAAPGTNTTQLATTAFIQAALAALVDSSPGTLDTLNELAAALGDDPNFATTLATALGLKAPLDSPVLTGVPEAPTAAPGTNTDQIATTAFVGAAVAAAGGGDVSGPASAVDNHLVVFDGTTGKLIKDGGVAPTGVNTGDQTNITGNAGTATALQTARTIGGVSFDGTGDITQPFDVHTFYPGVPTASAKLYRGKVARALVAPANFAGAQFTGTVNATASTVFDVQKNGVSCGTCTIAAGTLTPTFATTGGAAVNFAAGDVLSVIAPATPDATLADPAITLVFNR